MPDLSEFRKQWRPLAACFIGMGSGLSINPFVGSAFAPYLIKDFGWSRSDMAGLGASGLLILLLLPFVGRAADTFGVRKTAAIGMFFFPATCLGMSFVDGNFMTYFWLFIAQTALSCTTTATIYTRVVAAAYSRWRGLALGLCALSPALIAVFGTPLLSWFVTEYGWRAGYQAVAAYSAVCAVITLILLPASPPRAVAKAERKSGAFRAVVSQRAFWLMAAASFLVSMPHGLVATQLKLVTLAQGVDDATAAWLVSAFAAGIIAGRIICGLLLDMFAPERVAAAFLVMPAFGLMTLASPVDAVPALAAAIFTVGLAFGGEGDVLGYLVARIFGIGVYSTTLGLLTAAIGGASATGSILLSYLLRTTDSFNGFLTIASVCVVIGSAMFLLLGPAVRAGPSEAAV